MTGMRRQPPIHPDQLPLNFESADALERVIEARVAARCEAESFRWRFRLVTIETILFSALVAAAGFTLGQPASSVLRATVLIGASCFATGLLLLSLTMLSGRLWARLHRGRTA